MEERLDLIKKHGKRYIQNYSYKLLELETEARSLRELFKKD